jgi:hypothetical protein
MRIVDAKVGQYVVVTEPKIRRTRGLQYAQVGINITPGIIAEVVVRAGPKSGWETGLRVKTATGVRWFATAAIGDRTVVPSVELDIKVCVHTQ